MIDRIDRRFIGMKVQYRPTLVGGGAIGRIAAVDEPFVFVTLPDGTTVGATAAELTFPRETEIMRLCESRR